MLLQNNIPFTSNRQSRTLLVIQSQVCSDLFQKLSKYQRLKTRLQNEDSCFGAVFLLPRLKCAACVSDKWGNGRLFATRTVLLIPASS